MNTSGNKQKANRAIAGGALVGVANGLFGGGGGMVAVPVMTGMLGYSPRRAHATAIAVIAPVCLISALPYIIGGWLNLSLVIPAALGNMAGGGIGAELLKILPARAVNLAFVVLMLAAGIRMVM